MADNSAPQRDPDVVSFGAFSGVRNDVTAERLGAADLYLGENVDLDKTGRVSRRSGRTLLNATPTHSLWADGGVLGFCVQGTALKQLALDYSLTTIKTGLTTGMPMSFAKVNDRVYMANGRETSVFDGGSVRSWGLPVPAVPGATAGYGFLPAGTYQFVATYLRGDGQESGAGLAGVITLAENSAINFTFRAPSDSSVVYQNVYISPPNGDKLFLAMTIPVASLSGSYANNSLELTYDLKTQFLSAPPAGHILGYYSGRMYVGVDDGVYFSEPFAYELFDLRNYIAMNGRVTLIAPLDAKEYLDRPGQNSGLFLGTDRTCGALIGSDPESFQYVPKTDYGAIEGTLDFVDGTLFSDGSLGARRIPIWLTAQGVCAGMPGMEIHNITRNKFTFAAAGRGAAIFEPNPSRFIAISNF